MTSAQLSFCELGDMATTTDKIASLETGLGGKQVVGKPQTGVAGSWLWEHVDTEQTTMQFGGYCLLTGELLLPAIRCQIFQVLVS